MSMTAAEVLKAYEDGKHRRYSLLFAVNGGAFAVLNYAAGQNKNPAEPVIGLLYPGVVCIGMAVFTGFMAYDIRKFGERMHGLDDALYQAPGKRVLRAISTLFVLGWLLAASPWRF